MSRQAYPKYKLFGCQWLEIVPAEWKVKRLRFCMRTNPTKSETHGLDSSISVSFVPMEAIGEYGGLRLDQTKPLDEVVTGYTYFRDGDVLVAKITPCFENWKGAIANGLENGVGFGTTELYVLRPGPDFDRKYLFYITLGHAFRNIGTSYMYGAGGQKRVPEDFVRNFFHPIPSLNQQRTVGVFLDQETARIDTLIEKKQRQIELLQEKRVALISHAVTKGLDPKVKMKDSGIEWLGEIPEHWGQKSLKYMTRILRGKFTHRPRNDPRMYDGSYPFIQTGDVAAAIKYIREYHQTLSEDGFAVSKMFPRGTLVMTIAANIGDIAILDFEACFPDSIVGFVPKREVSLDYLYYLFIGMRPALLSTATLNTQFNLNIDRIGSVMAVHPPLAEQRAIVEHLETQVKKMNNLTAQIDVSIMRLREYRTALISAAVTGKIDVRQEVA